MKREASGDTRDKLDRIKEAGQRGAGAVADVFSAATNGADAARQAVANLLMEMARIQTMKAFAGLAGSGGATGGFFSALGGLLSFDGGGSTGMGPRSGGLDGKGGFLAMMHPRETVTDHTKGQRGGGAMKVDVGVSFDNDGNLQAYVRSVAQREAASATQAGIGQFERGMPGMNTSTPDDMPDEDFIPLCSVASGKLEALLAMPAVEPGDVAVKLYAFCQENFYLKDAYGTALAEKEARALVGVTA